MSSIISRARATVGVDEKLNDLVTLQMVGQLEPVARKVPPAKIVIISRKPASQRMEIRVDDIVETTFLNGEEGCLVRSNSSNEAAQMRYLTQPEIERVAYNTRQLFSFFSPDFKHGERVTYEGLEMRRGVRCHKLLYTYPDGMSTTRYFCTETDVLISTVTDNGIESVAVATSTVQGIIFPKVIEYYNDGKKMHVISLSKIIVNNPLPEGIFDFPKMEQNDGS